MLCVCVIIIARHLLGHFLNGAIVSGRKDIKGEFQVMASALSKEMEMMESQLNRWKETAREALSLREESQSLRALLARKVPSYCEYMVL